MKSLVTEAKHKLAVEHPGLVIYTVSIWTDPDAAVSAINFDTLENSIACIGRSNEWRRGHYDQLKAEGKDEETARFLPQMGRNENPADFSPRAFISIKNASFPGGWAQQSKGRCWRELKPALQSVVEVARSEFHDLPLHPEAEVGINSRRDWYDQTWPLVNNNRIA